MTQQSNQPQLPQTVAMYSRHKKWYIKILKLIANISRIPGKQSFPLEAERSPFSSEFKQVALRCS